MLTRYYVARRPDATRPFQVDGHGITPALAIERSGNPDSTVSTVYDKAPSTAYPTIYALAASFARGLRATIGPDAIVKVNRGNRERRSPANGIYMVPSVCDSHDYCDANMVMDAAFTRVIGRHMTMPSDVEANPDLDAQEDADLALWNEAWAVAAFHNFDVNAILTHGYFSAHGFAFWNTGGNCTAYGRELPDGRRVYIVDENEDATIPARIDRGVEYAVFDAEDNVIAEGRHDSARMIEALDDVIRKGTPATDKGIYPNG